MEDLCRVCMDNSDILADIFSSIKNTQRKREKASCIADILNELTGCELLVNCKNGPPQYICTNCIKRAFEALDFKRLVERNTPRFIKRERKMMEAEVELNAICDMLDLEDLEFMTKEEPLQDSIVAQINTNDILDPGDLQFMDNFNKEAPKSIIADNQKPKNKHTSGSRGGSLRCPHCHLTLSNKGSLTNHLRIHTGERPFQCPHCSKNFVQKHGLVVHIRTHTGERPYQCASCPEAFAQMAGLIAHHRRRPWHNPKESKNRKLRKRHNDFEIRLI